MPNFFSAIRQSRVSEDIVKQIKGLIRDGKLKPGDKLPSERQLAMTLAVGRSSLREAINSLSMMGLVEVRQRKGVFVRTVSTPLVTDPLRQLMSDGQNVFADLYDIRIDIEAASARAAAEHRTDAQLSVISQSLDEMQKQCDERLHDTANDLRFHLAIAEASNNFLRVHIIKEIFDLAGEHIHSILQRIASDRDNISTFFNQHAAIYQGILNKEAAKSGAAMREHLEWVKYQVDPHL